MKESSALFLGNMPSLTDSSSTFLKSRLRVSSKPMICRPLTGSPENGMAVTDSTRCNKV